MRRTYLVFFALILSVVSILFSLSKGSTSISFYQLLFGQGNELQTVLIHLRALRTSTAFVTGALLALAGALMQLLLQNPLADPFVLGISGGAAFCTLLFMFMGLSERFLTGGAWAGSLFTMVIIFFFGQKQAWQNQKLLLMGISLAAIFSACISLIFFMSPNSQLRSMLFWLGGDLTQLTFPWLGFVLLVGGCFAGVLLAPGLNILMRGELAATTLGLSPQRFKWMLFILSSLFTAEAVVLAGCIGFVGLIIPHVARLMVGYDHRFTLPLSILLGGSLVTVADTLSRTLLAPEQIPIGIIMTLIGVPSFIALLHK